MMSNLCEVGKGLLQPSKQPAHRRRRLAYAGGEPVNPIGNYAPLHPRKLPERRPVYLDAFDASLYRPVVNSDRLIPVASNSFIICMIFLLFRLPDRAARFAYSGKTS
jgi:hypothetical protein